ncbi:MAG: THUMP domain-containing class I SAM-dependent RNA methyltransferase [Gemmatimonadaceae bacterium]
MPKRPAGLSCFAATAPGIESLCAAELGALGVRGTAGIGGVAFNGDLTAVARANLWLRTASRVLVRVAEFRATAFYELELHAKRIAWARYIAPGTRVVFRVTCKKSKLYHSDAVAERLEDAVRRAVPNVETERASDADDDETMDAARQLFIVRFLHDRCTVSADTSGTLLHLRGYRQQVAKAPLRETLAAAVLLGAGWTGDAPLTDPMCGSGTIPIEAALIARRMAPGMHRSFAFQRWPEADASAMRTVVDDARTNELARAPVKIEGYDRDAGAIDAARANAERAGVEADIELGVQPISALAPAAAPGLIASNPPYGVRIGDGDRLRNLYAQLGNVARRARPGWTVALLSADRALDREVGRLEERFATRNGGIPVRLVVGSASDEARPRPIARRSRAAGTASR